MVAVTCDAVVDDAFLFVVALASECGGGGGGAVLLPLSLSEKDVEMATISTSSMTPVDRRSCSYVANSSSEKNSTSNSSGSIRGHCFNDVMGG